MMENQNRLENRDSFGAGQQPLYSTAAKKQTLTRAAISLHSMRLGGSLNRNEPQFQPSTNITERCNRL